MTSGTLLPIPNAVDLPVSADNRSSLASQTVTVNLRLQRSDNPEH
jgi:hypothetical protein